MCVRVHLSALSVCALKHVHVPPFGAFLFLRRFMNNLSTCDLCWPDTRDEILVVLKSHGPYQRSGSPLEISEAMAAVERGWLMSG